MLRARTIFLIILIFSLSTVISGQDADMILRAEFPADLFTIPGEGPFYGLPESSYQPIVPKEEAALALLEEARWVFAGMAWGFDYSYTPSDRARAIAERFEIKPRGSIPWGDSSLQIGQCRIEEMTLYCQVAWNPPPHARAEVLSWNTAGHQSAQGRGKSHAILGVEDTVEIDGRTIPGRLLARRDAILEAVREAIRAHLQSIERSKPREVTGSFAFSAPPRIHFDSLEYIAQVRIRLSVEEVRGYSAW